MISFLLNNSKPKSSELINVIKRHDKYKIYLFVTNKSIMLSKPDNDLI